MLRDPGKANMSASATTPIKAAPPVMLCRLCHCEFTNFKEHVKSLVHLDARETKLAAQPPTKHKGSDEDSGESAKRAKRISVDEKSHARESNDGEDKSGGNKETVSSDDKADTLIPADVDDLPELSEEEEDDEPDDADLNGTAIVKTESKYVPEKHAEPDEIKKYADETGKPLSKGEKLFLYKSWYCKLCLHVHRVEDQSFDGHAHEENHEVSLERRLESLKNNYRWKKSCRWLIHCAACSFYTNDKDQFISHLLTEQHEKNLKEIIGDDSTVPLTFTDDKSYWDKELTGRRMKIGHPVTNKKPKNNSKPPATTAPAHDDRTKQNNTNSKPSTPQASRTAPKITPEKNLPKVTSAKPAPRITSAKDAPKITLEKPHYERFQGGSNPPRNASQNIRAQSSPKPLMSLSLPDALNQNKSGWKSTSTVTRNKSPSNQPGILGEYRPSFSLNNFGFESLKRDDPFGRPDSLRHPGIGLGRLGAGRPTYSEVNRDPLSATQARTFQLDSYRDAFGSGQSSVTSPLEKLNSVAFGALEHESPSRQFDILSDLLVPQRPGVLPSSLDLASNSSIRFKYGSDRGAMFDNYPASGPSLSRIDFRRNDSSRTHSSRQDLSKSDRFLMFSRR